MGKEMAVSAVIRTPDEMLTAKQAQSDMRYAEPKLTNEQLAPAQRDAGKKVEVIKDPRLQENINTMKIAEVKDGVKMGGTIVGGMAVGPPQATGKIAEVKDGMKMGGMAVGPPQATGKIAEVQDGVKMGAHKIVGGIAAVDKMKKEDSIAPPPPAAYNVKQNAIAYLADPARTSKMIGKSTGTIDICKSTCDSKPECTHFDRVGNSCTLYKGAEWVGRYPGGQSYCKSQCQT
jgi:hypothetical protein